MKFETYWQAVVKKYPSFSDPDNKIQLTSRGIKRLLEQSYGHGKNESTAKTPEVENFFETLFKGKK